MNEVTETEAPREHKRQLRGMGRIFQRGNVYWIGYYFRGKEYRESSLSTNAGEAKKLLKKRLGEMGRGKLVGPAEEKVTFDEIAEMLRQDYKVNARKAAKAIAYPIKHLENTFGLDRALDITTDRINAHIAQRQDSGAKNATINRELAALKRMFSLAIQAGKLSHKPYIPTLEENNARQGFLDYGSFLSLCAALPSHLKDPVAFLYHSGWRISEMRALEWRDVDLPGKVIRLRPELSKNKDGRLLPLHGELLALIRRASAQRRLDCVFVFHLAGEKIGTFRKAWKTACKNAGLLGTIPHDLRRCAVRNLVRAGVAERIAMTLSGHKTRNIFDRYNIVSEADLLQAAERVQAHLATQPTEPAVVSVKAAG
jgi:integrase